MEYFTDAPNYLIAELINIAAPLQGIAIRTGKHHIVFKGMTILSWKEMAPCSVWYGKWFFTIVADTTLLFQTCLFVLEALIVQLSFRYQL
jgi:hypothetical protein